MMSKTPKLRFKEFSGDWEEKKLGDLGEFKKTYSFSRSVEVEDEGLYKHIHYGDIHMNYNGIVNKEKNIPSIDIPISDNYEFVKKRDIIFADASEDRKDLGKVAVVQEIDNNVISGLHTICFRPDDSINSEFFLNHSLNDKYLKYMYTRGNGAKVLGISKSNLSEYKFLAPSIEEQEKIASFFSLIDDKISLQSEKLEMLKDYKKGMMQKIFSRELRFKDDEGRYYPEWEEKKLGDCIDTITDYVAAGSFASIRENVQYKNNKDYAQLIRTVDLKSKFKNDDSFVYVDKKAFEFLYRVNLNEESIILPNVGNIGEVYFIKPENLPNENNVLAPNSILLRSSQNYNEFLYQLFSTKKFRDSLDIITSKSGQPKFNKTELKEIRLNIPTKQEQIKISKLLKSIDLKIEKEQEKLDSLNEYKKGLLQQMFV